MSMAIVGCSHFLFFNLNFALEKAAEVPKNQ